MLRNKKKKGTLAENELIHKFWDNGYASIRSAGSGSTKHPSPDILVSNGVKKMCFEIKSVSSTKKYFKTKEIEELETFSKIFGCEAWIGIKFIQNQWFFIPTKELKEKKQSFFIDLIICKKIGFNFEDII